MRGVENDPATRTARAEAGAQLVPTAGTYQIDPAHTFVDFTAQYLRRGPAALDGRGREKHSGHSGPPPASS
jgi:hypothetical protein